MHKRLLSLLKFCKNTEHHADGEISLKMFVEKDPITAFRYLPPQITHTKQFNGASDIFYTGICLLEVMLGEDCSNYNRLSFIDDKINFDGLIEPVINRKFRDKVNELIFEMLVQYPDYEFDKIYIRKQIQELLLQLFDFSYNEENIWVRDIIITDAHLYNLGKPETYLDKIIIDWIRTGKEYGSYYSKLNDFFTYLEIQLGINSGIISGKIHICGEENWKNLQNNELSYIIIEKNDNICYSDSRDSSCSWELDSYTRRIYKSGLKIYIDMSLSEK